MDPQDRPEIRLDGAECAACGRAVPEASVRVLAERDDLAFVEVDCPSCGSESLAILLGSIGDAPAVSVELSSEAGPALGLDDVQAMRTFLAGYRGDLRALVDARRRESSGPA